VSFYVEVMCDERKSWSPENHAKGPLRNRCRTDCNDNPQGPTARDAAAEARAQGWKVRGKYACCPSCLKEPVLNRGVEV
jgi:hypothetical protein